MVSVPVPTIKPSQADIWLTSDQLWVQIPPRSKNFSFFCVVQPQILSSANAIGKEEHVWSG